MRFILIFILFISGTAVFGQTSKTAILSGFWIEGLLTWGLLNGAPDASDIAVIPSNRTITVTGNQSCLDLVINDGGEIIINSGATLTIVRELKYNGTIQNNGTLIINPGGKITKNKSPSFIVNGKFVTTSLFILGEEEAPEQTE